MDQQHQLLELTQLRRLCGEKGPAERASPQQSYRDSAHSESGVSVCLRSPRPAPGSCHGTYGIYRNARADGTIQVPPDVPNQTDANFVLKVLTGQRERTHFDLRGHPQVSCLVGVR